MVDLSGAMTSRLDAMAIQGPKEALLEWLSAFWKRKGLEQYRNYIPEENTVLVIPNMDRFSEVGSLGQFLDEMKPKLLFAELGRFHASPEDFGRPLTKDTFDEFFDTAGLGRRGDSFASGQSR